MRRTGRGSFRRRATAARSAAEAWPRRIVGTRATRQVGLRIELTRAEAHQGGGDEPMEELAREHPKAPSVHTLRHGPAATPGYYIRGRRDLNTLAALAHIGTETDPPIRSVSQGRLTSPTGGQGVSSCAARRFTGGARGRCTPGARVRYAPAARVRCAAVRCFASARPRFGCLVAALARGQRTARARAVPGAVTVAGRGHRAAVPARGQTGLRIDAAGASQQSREPEQAPGSDVHARRLATSKPRRISCAAAERVLGRARRAPPARPAANGAG